MSGFVASVPEETPTLQNDGFWPDIDTGNLRDAQRITAAVTAARLEAATVSAMISVNRELKHLKTRYTEAGHATLAEVPAEQIAGESDLLHLYRRAIYSTVSAEVVERYRTFDATGAGEKKAEEVMPSAEEYRRDARFAIRDLLDITHITVELI